jgi:small conductance mechanosensitive channel
MPASLSLDAILNAYVVPLAWKLLGALALWVIGGWVIGALVRLTRAAMLTRKMDPTLVNYADSALRVVLRVVLVIAILGVFGVETTSLAALLAAAGVAIGAAWAGLLSNFAAGAFLLVLRPFKVGDMITGGGVTGTVRELGLFATSIDTPDNVRVYIGNAKLFSDNVTNYVANPFRRVDLKAQLAFGVDPKEAMSRLAARLALVPNVATAPTPDLAILEFNERGTLLAVRPYCHNDHYWQVYFDTNRAIQEVASDASWPPPAVAEIQFEGGARG